MSNNPKRKIETITDEPLALRPERERAMPEVAVQDTYDQDGNRTGVLVNGTYYPVQDTAHSTAAAIPGVDVDLFDQAEHVIADGQRRIREQLRDQHAEHQRDIEEEYEGEILGTVRGGVAKFRDGLEHHQQMREVRAADRQVWQQANQRFSQHVFDVMDIHADIYKTQLSAGLEEYRAQQRGKEALFDLDLQLKPERERQYHEKDMAKQAQDHTLDLKKLEVEERKLERGDAREEAALDRAHELVQQTYQMGNRLPELLFELQTMHDSQPDEILSSTIKLVGDAMTAFGNLGSDLSKEERASIAPFIQHAYNEAFKALRRYGRGGGAAGMGAKK